MERRFKKIYISAEVVASHGKGFGQALKDRLPNQSTVLWTKECLDTGCLVVLVNNESFDLLEDNELVPTWQTFELERKINSTIIAPH